MRWSRPRTTLLLALAGVLGAGSLAPAAAAPGAAPAPAPAPVTAAAAAARAAAGGTEPVHSYADAIRETVFVESAVDSDGDGRRDRIHADVIRPRATATGLKVPVIYEMSPYRAGLNDVPNHGVDVEELPPPGQRRDVPPRSLAAARADGPTVFPGYYDNYFVPRGYAVVLAESIGSGRSDGCPTSGDRNETLGTTAVIDWLNGRAPAWDSAGAPVAASWTTGAVGMIGASYNGTLPIAAASTGVRGLRTIVPIAAITSWYDYYRANGLVVAPGGFQGEDADVLARAVLTRPGGAAACAALMDRIEREQDRTTGDYTAFWRARDYRPDLAKLRTSVFAVHGLNDWNVKTRQVAQLWQSLERRDVPRKLWLHQGAHLNPFSIRRAEWLRQLHAWFDQWLYGIDTGIMREPRVDVERSAGSWETHRAWSGRTAPAGGPVRPIFLAAAGTAGHGRLTPLPAGLLGGTESFTDDVTRTAEELAAVPTSRDPQRLAYLTAPLTRPLRLSGTAALTLTARVDNRPAANLTALLVDYGTDTRVNYDAALKVVNPRDCYGEGIPGDTGCAALYEHAVKTSPFEIVSRGWLDPNNRFSAAVTTPVRQGREYLFRWDFQADDYVFKPGHRIGLVVLSSDRAYTLRPKPGTRITVRPGTSALWLPVAAAP